MSSLGIFILGIFVTGLTFTAVLMVGLQEAADDSLTSVKDLTEFEKNAIGRVTEEK